MASLCLAKEPTGQGRPLLAEVRTAVTPEGQSLERARGEFRGEGVINVIDLDAGFMNLWNLLSYMDGTWCTSLHACYTSVNSINIAVQLSKL